MKKYGISLEKKSAIYLNQNKCCLGCNERFLLDELRVDHCHQTQKIRGLLCNICNTALGFLGDGHGATVQTAKKLIQYIG